ncbi:MAG: hypothetical protein AB1416_07335 [Actinomycetota bacterium]
MLVVPDGASEPLGAAPTSLEQARTPGLDAVAAAGAVRRVRTVPDGLPAGSETCIPTLLGRPPARVPGRGRIEAASARIGVRPGTTPWRVDVLTPEGAPGDVDLVARAADLLAAHVEAVHRLRGHRLLAVAEGWPALPEVAGAHLVLWEDGPEPGPALIDGTVVVCGPGAAEGVARLLGLEVVRPPGATGGLDADLGAKAGAALDAIAGGARRVVVHVGAPDEAAHRRDPAAKVAALEAIDAAVIGPLWEAVRARGGRLAVCPDHGADPSTGAHDGSPVPAACAGQGVAPAGPGRMTERAVAGLPAVAAPPVPGWGAP